MKKLPFLPLLIGPLAFYACKFEAEHKDESRQESWSYQLNENGCDTGAHAFSSKDAYCRGLADDALNKGCAATLRQNRLESECGAPPADETGDGEVAPIGGPSPQPQPTKPEPVTNPSVPRTLSLEAKASGGLELVRSSSYNIVSARIASVAVTPGTPSPEWGCINLGEAHVTGLGLCQNVTVAGTLNSKTSGTVQLTFVDKAGETHCKFEAERISTLGLTLTSFGEVPTCSGEPVSLALRIKAG